MMMLMEVDGKPIVAFKDKKVCDQYEYPRYIQRYTGLRGVKVRRCTGDEFKKYKRTRGKKTTMPRPEQLILGG
jgi:hypothetical protein